MSSEYGPRSDDKVSEPDQNIGKAEKPDQKLEEGECYHYENEGTLLVYTDPTTQAQYILNEDKSDWIPREKKENDNQYKFDGKTYNYKDAEGRLFKWDLDQKEWKKQDEVQGESTLSLKE